MTTPAAPRSPAPVASPAEVVFPGESEMAARCRAFDWAATPLGPVATWSESLCTAAGLVVAAPIGMILLWGPALVQLYNDAYAAIMGAKHPGGLGQRNVECWPEVWDFTGPIYDAVLTRGEAFTFEDQRLVLERGGAPEETFFTLTYSPVRRGTPRSTNASGTADAHDAAVGGILVTVVETTARVQARSAREAALEVANAQLEDQALELELANQQLQEQAAELELQADALQETAATLEAQVEVAERAAAALVASERQFHTLADTIPTLAWTAGPDGAIDWYNAQWYAYTATTPEEMAGWGWQSVHDPVVLPDVLARWQASIATGAPFEMTFPLRGADGVFRPFLTRVAPVRGADGAIVRWVGTNTDITGERAAAAALAASEARFRAVQDASPDGFQRAEAIRNSDGRVIDFIYRYLNPAGLALTGRTPDAMLGRRMLDVFPGLAGDPLFARYAGVAETGVPFVDEVRYSRDGLDGGFRVVVVRVADGSDGAPVEIALAFSDLTDRLRAEADARTSAARLQRVLDTSPVAVMECDAAGGITYVNAMAETTLGVPRDAAVRRAFDAPAWAITTPDGVPVAADVLPVARALRGETVRDYEHAVVDAAGTRRVIRVNATPIRAPAGGGVGSATSPVTHPVTHPVTGVVVAFFDVTATHAAAVRTGVLHALATALATATTSTDVGRALIAYGARPLGAQHATLGLLTPDAVRGSDPDARRTDAMRADGPDVDIGPTLEIVLADALPDATREAFARIPLDATTRTALPFAEAAATGRACYVESPAALAARYPKVAPVAARMGVGAVAALPLVVAEGTPDARVIGAVAFDFTGARAFPPEERALLETVARQAAQAMDRALQFDAAHAARAAAETARARADAANQTKTLFLANMSHELRTPLNAIGGYVQLLEMELHGPVTPDQRAALGRVQVAQRRLLGLINDVLNHAKLAGGRVEYDVRAVDVRDVLADVVPLVEPQLTAKGLVFDVRVPDDAAPNAPPLVWADREKLGQVLVNLLSNATKFTDARHPVTGAPGRVVVQVTTRAGIDAAVFLRVVDTGRGIPREKQEAIFEPFVQVRTGYAHATEGTGLGLAISRDLARGMGGDLRVRSREGEGATFTLTLRPVRAPDGTTVDRRTPEERRVDEDRRERADRRAADPADAAEQPSTTDAVLADGSGRHGAV
ncbi:MAG TPA: ATP-binding protein [Gemmatirosa sp.]